MKTIKQVLGSPPDQIDLAENIKREDSLNIIEYTSLVEMIKTKNWPDEFLIHPEDFAVMLQKFGRPMYVGFDERSMFMFVGLTRIRPSRDVESLNWS